MEKKIVTHHLRVHIQGTELESWNFVYDAAIAMIQE